MYDEPWHIYSARSDFFSPIIAKPSVGSLHLFLLLSFFCFPSSLDEPFAFLFDPFVFSPFSILLSWAGVHASLLNLVFGTLTAPHLMKLCSASLLFLFWIFLQILHWRRTLETLKDLTASSRLSKAHAPLA